MGQFRNKRHADVKFQLRWRPPTTDVLFENSHAYKNADRTFFGPGLTARLETTDGDGSGVSETYISIDGALFEPYRGPLSFSSEKEYTLRSYAVDHVGYAGEPQVAVFSVDLTAPVSRHEVINNFQGSVLSAGAAIRITSTDKLTGARIFSSFDDSSKSLPYEGPDLQVGHLPDGDHVLTYYAEDQVKNREPNNTFTFYLDKTAPQVAHALEGDHHTVIDKIFVSPRTRIGLAATDNKIGVDRMEFQFDHGVFEKYTSPIAIPLKGVTTTVTYRAADLLNNMSQTSKFDIYIDRSAPKSRLSFSGPHFEQRGKIWLTQETRISILSTDTESGVQNIYYRKGADSETRYSEAFAVASEGPLELDFWSVDQVNNREENHKVALAVDNTPPRLLRPLISPVRIRPGMETARLFSPIRATRPYF